MATPAVIEDTTQAFLHPGQQVLEVPGTAPCTREQVIHGLASAWKKVAAGSGRRTNMTSSPSVPFVSSTTVGVPMPSFGKGGVSPTLLSSPLSQSPPSTNNKRWQPRWPSFTTTTASSPSSSSNNNTRPGMATQQSVAALSGKMLAPPAVVLDGGVAMNLPVSGSTPAVRSQHTARLWNLVANSITSRRANGTIPFLGQPGASCSSSSSRLPYSGTGVVSTEAAQHMVYSLQEYHYKCLKHSVLLRLTQDKSDAVDCLPQGDECCSTTHELVRARTALATSAFYVIDLSMVVRQFCAWRYNLPLIEPRFSLQAHADPVVVKAMTLLGVKVCCSSLADLEVIKSLTARGYAPEALDIKPCKTPSLLAATLQAGIRTLTVDSADEIERIARRAQALGIAASDLTLVVRLRGPQYKGFSLGATQELLPSLLATAAARGMSVQGVSLDVRHFAGHDASPEGQITAALSFCRSTLALCSGSTSARLTHVSLLGLDKMLMGALLQATIVLYFPPSSGVTVSIDATAHLVDNSATLVTRIIGKRSADFADGISRGFHYYLDDGCYGSLGDVFLHKKKFMASPLSATGGAGELESVHLYPSTLWGPTCDGLDCIDKMTTLPEMEIGDWIYFRNVGSVAFSARTHFNGLTGPKPSHCFTGVGCVGAA